jgi:hypothetical protein
VRARRPPVGTTVKAWAERHLDAETLDTLVLPAIADLQHEAARSERRASFIRWSVRLRGYVALGEALGLHLLSRRVPPARTSELAVSRVAVCDGRRGGIMTESNRNLLAMTGAGVLVAAVAFAAGRLSVPAPVPAPAWQAPAARSVGPTDDVRALQRTLDEQRREAAVRDGRFQQQLEQQRYDADREKEKLERARMDAETEFAAQRTQQLLDQQRHDADMQRLREESARREAEAQALRLRTQLLLDELSRKQ